MINPRTLIRALDKHWDIIEQLVLTAREQLTWESETLLPLLQQTYIQDSLAQHQERLQQMVNADILVELPRSSVVELNNMVRDFASQLLHEHQLGLSDIVKIRIAEIKTALETLHSAMRNQDMAALQRGVSSIDQQLRHITEQLQQDAHAIADIAERAKTADNQLPLARRYQEVLETYDRYIEPMTDLMDTGAGGTFYPLLEQTEGVLDVLSEQLAIQGALISHQRSLQLLNFRVKDLRRVGRETLKYCTNTLMPLREEVRRHNQLSTAVAKLLSDVRKRGLKRTFANSKLPQWRKEQTKRITVDSSLLTFMAQARGYTPKSVVFPDIVDDGKAERPELLDEKAIEQHTLNSLPIDDLMRWLVENYGQYQDATLIKLYHRLIRLPSIQAVNQHQETRHELKHLAIQLYSHRLTAHEHRP
jgi:hypothetical protein